MCKRFYFCTIVVPISFEIMTLESKTDRLMISAVLSSSILLSRTFRRFRLLALLQSAVIVGVLPFLLYAPRLEWVRIILVLLLFVYLICKSYQFVRAHQAIKQMRLEQQFMLYSHHPEQLYRCLQNPDHLWNRSCILTGLKSITSRPLPVLLRAEEKKRRAHQQFDSVFNKLRPSVLIIDSILLLLIMGGLVSHPLIPISLVTLMFQAGLLAIGIAFISEIGCLILRQKALLILERFEDALTEWTLETQYSEIILQSIAKPYRHKLLYSSRAWFNHTSISPTRPHRRNEPVRVKWPGSKVA